MAPAKGDNVTKAQGGEVAVPIPRGARRHIVIAATVAVPYAPSAADEAPAENTADTDHQRDGEA